MKITITFPDDEVILNYKMDRLVANIEQHDQDIANLRLCIERHEIEKENLRAIIRRKKELEAERGGNSQDPV